MFFLIIVQRTIGFQGIFEEEKRKEKEFKSGKALQSLIFHRM